MTSFLNLPGEIRNEIYARISPTEVLSRLTVDFVMSCKQVHTEAEAIILKSVHAFLSSVENDCMKQHAVPLRILRPQSYQELQRLTIRLPLSLYVRDWTYLGMRLDAGLPLALNPLFGLSLSSLAIEMYDDGGQKRLFEYLPSALMGHLELLLSGRFPNLPFVPLRCHHVEVQFTTEKLPWIEPKLLHKFVGIMREDYGNYAMWSLTRNEEQVPVGWSWHRTGALL